jgi:hypothetical protein
MQEPNRGNARGGGREGQLQVPLESRSTGRHALPNRRPHSSSAVPYTLSMCTALVSRAPCPLASMRSAGHGLPPRHPPRPAPTRSRVSRFVLQPLPEHSAHRQGHQQRHDRERQPDTGGALCAPPHPRVARPAYVAGGSARLLRRQPTTHPGMQGSAAPHPRTLLPGGCSTRSDNGRPQSSSSRQPFCFAYSGYGRASARWPHRARRPPYSSPRVCVYRPLVPYHQVYILLPPVPWSHCGEARVSFWWRLAGQGVPAAHRNLSLTTVLALPCLPRPPVLSRTWCSRCWQRPRRTTTPSTS